MAVLANCSICTEIVRFFLQPAVGRKDGTGKAENTKGKCSLIFTSLLVEEFGKGLGWPQLCSLATLQKPRLWEMCCGTLEGSSCWGPDARPHTCGWVGVSFSGVPTVDYLELGFEDLGGRSGLGEERWLAAGQQRACPVRSFEIRFGPGCWPLLVALNDALCHTSFPLVPDL